MKINIFSKIKSSKYLEIIFAVGLFIILDAGVLIINFYTSYQIGNDAHAIQVASRQTTLSQNLFHELYQVRDDASTLDQNYIKSVDKLAETYKTLDETMDAFLYGGELIGVGQGKDSLLKDSSYRQANEANLKEAEAIWQQYRMHVKGVAYAYFNDLTREDVVVEADEAIAFARENNAKFNVLLDNVSKSMEDVAQRKAERLRLIQAIGITLAVLNFFLILFHFLRKLRQSDAQVEKAQRETADILSNVNEGLLLLDRQFTIGSQHSSSLKSIFRQESFSGRNFFDLLKPMVTEKTLSITRDYVEILFSENVSPSLVADLNPLNEVEIHLNNEGGDFSTSYLSFVISRVIEDKKLAFLLVTVSDVTDKVRLEQELKKAEEKAVQDIEMLLQVIHLDGNLLLTYLANVAQSLSVVNSLLKHPSKTQPQYMEKVLKISRIIHALKGECASLDLTFIETKLHDYETAIEPLKLGSKLSGSDFIPLVVRLNQLMSDVRTVKILVQKISGSSAVENTNLPNTLPSTYTKPVTGGFQSLSTLEAWKPQFENLVAQVAKDHNKSARLMIEGSGLSRVNQTLKDAIRDITIQCLRNAIVHGIEAPSLRGSSGKNLTGNIRVTIEHEDGVITLKIRDDGNGIDIDAIRAKALSKGLCTEAQAQSWQAAQLIKLIFKPGFSTFASANGIVDKHAGRGVGLDVVKSILDQHGGKMSVSYRSGEYTEFKFRFESGINRQLAATA